jgi:hypothetical protein
MKRFLISTVCGGLVVAFLHVPAMAQTDDPGIQKRMENQENRIEQGIASGQLTPRETGRLEAQQTKIKQDELRMKSDGVLTAREQAKLTREQNRASRRIYRQKHDVQQVNTK